MPEMIRCPSCNTEIEVAQALAGQVEARLRGEILAEAAARAREDAAAELTSLAEELAKAKQGLAAARKAETTLRRRERELEEREQAIDSQVETRLQEETKRIRGAAREQALRESQEAAARSAERLEELERQLSDREGKLQEARRKELELLQKQRELDDKQAELDLELQRRIAEEGGKIREAARKAAREEHLMAAREKDEQIDGLRRKIEELRQRADQGSQQLQGEAQELVLEEVLAASFSHDVIEGVPKGVHGGDVVQHVHDTAGGHCGTILWESKRTKSWSNTWLPKLRDDLREAKAVQAVIVSRALPEGCDTFDKVDDVWVTSWPCAVPLATALRSELIQVAAAQRALTGQHGKMEMLYEYLSGTQFRNRVSGMVEALDALRQDLDAEKRAMFKLWSKREQQLERAIISSSGFYGDLEGIIGGTLPELEGLAFPTLPAGSEPAEDLATVRLSDTDLERIVSYLEESRQERTRAEIIVATGITDSGWATAAPALSLDPRIEKVGRGRGTRYRFRFQVAG